MRVRVSNIKRQAALRLRHRLTLAEAKLWRLLRSRQLQGLKFRRQVPVGPWIVDFVSYEKKIVVEADGGQHLNSQKDAVRDSDLRSRGFQVFRFWNNDILNDTESVLQEILRQAPSPRSLRLRPSPTRGEGKEFA